MARRLTRDFFARATVDVARDLLGQRLVHAVDGQRLSGIISEVEAYVGEADLACHAKAGKTARTAVMYGPPGLAYVYFTYGMHWMLNVITEREGFPAAVLLRGVWPEEGMAVMRARRGRPDRILTDGPAKLTQALGVDKAHNGLDMCAAGAQLYFEEGPGLPEGTTVVAGPRVGLGKTPEPWLSMPWNFRLAR